MTQVTFIPGVHHSSSPPDATPAAFYTTYCHTTYLRVLPQITTLHPRLRLARFPTTTTTWRLTCAGYHTLPTCLTQHRQPTARDVQHPISTLRFCHTALPHLWHRTGADTRYHAHARFAVLAVVVAPVGAYNPRPPLELATHLPASRWFGPCRLTWRWDCVRRFVVLVRLPKTWTADGRLHTTGIDAQLVWDVVQLFPLPHRHAYLHGYFTLDGAVQTPAGATFTGWTNTCDRSVF